MAGPVSKLHKLPAEAMSEYAEHSASAKAHYTIASNLSRKGHFESAAFSHHKKQAYANRDAAHDMVKSSPVSSSMPMPMAGYKNRDMN